MQCRMPKKMKLCGMANQVAAVTSRAAPAIRPKRRRKIVRSRPLLAMSDRLTPESSRKVPAIARAKAIQSG